jgi:hypothetical protein
MGDFWDQLMYWLSTNQTSNKQLLPRAERAEDRYANSERYFGEQPGKYILGSWPTQGVRQNYTGPVGDLMFRSDVMPAEIYRYIPEQGDTVYVEKPTRSDSKYGLIQRRSRKASTKNPKGNEYNILKRRFDTAWRLAK